MDDFGIEISRGEAKSVKPRQRFLEKIALAGYDSVFDPSSTRRLQADQWNRLTAAVRHAMETLALVWPDKAYAFHQVIVQGRLVEDVAADKGVSERTVRRWLTGHNQDLGAEDWFIVTLELYREANEIIHNGGDWVHDCFLAAKLGERDYGPLERPLFLLLLEALAGGALATVANTLPWREREGGEEVGLAWPCSRLSPPLPASRMPGLLATLHGARTDELMVLLPVAVLLRGQYPDEWWRMLGVLNEMGLTRAEPASESDSHDAPQGVITAGLMLRLCNAPLRYALLAFLACSSLDWSALCNGIGFDAHLKTLKQEDRVQYCARRFLGA